MSQRVESDWPQSRHFETRAEISVIEICPVDRTPGLGWKNELWDFLFPLLECPEPEFIPPSQEYGSQLLVKVGFAGFVTLGGRKLAVGIVAANQNVPVGIV